VARDDSFRDFILEQLGDGIECRAMFGGHGLYRDARFFGILYQGRFYLKTSPRTRKDFTGRGMTPFRPNARQTLRSYYEVPADVVEKREVLRRWAERAWATSPGA
jgi:DNA transformation protein and related proteins